MYIYTLFQNYGGIIEISLLLRKDSLQINILWSNFKYVCQKNISRMKLNYRNEGKKT